MQPGTGATIYTLSYDAENRLVEVKKNNVTLMNLVYDGDGQRVKSTLAGTPNSTVIRFVGSLYEYETVGSTTNTRQYYYAGSLRVALRFQEFSPPLQNLATHFIETWEFRPSDHGTATIRSMSLYPKGVLGWLVLLPISRLMKKAFEKQRDQLGGG